MGRMRSALHIPALPDPFLTCLHPHTLQINRPPVKLNLLTCQVRPHAEEKKCFDLVTRECLSHVPMGIAHGKSLGFPSTAWSSASLRPFHLVLVMSPEGPTSARRWSKLKGKRGCKRA